MKILSTIFLILITLNIKSYAQSFQVGHKQQTFIDASRSNRNITTEIYYPADMSGDNVSIASGQFPVLVFGHGFLMAWSAYADIWNEIVPNGYILVFPTTETSFFPSHTNFGKDIAFLVGAMKTEGTNAASTFFGGVATTSAAMGHSMGGGSAFLSVQYDPSITALATLAAANTNPSSINAAKNIGIPSIVIAGANDCVAPPPQHQLPMYDALSSACKTYVTIIGGSHCQFANTNTNCSLGELTCSPPPAISPILQQNTTSSLLLPWLNYYLKNDIDAGLEFQNLITKGNGIESQQNCLLLSTEKNEHKNKSVINIYPNPFSSETTVQANIPMKNATLTVHNDLGQQIMQLKNIYGNTVSLSRGGLPSGLYFIRLTEDNKILATKKIIVQD